MGTYVRLRGVTVVVLTFLLFSCTENADLFSSLDDPEEPGLSTVAAGAVVSPDEPLSIQLEYPNVDSPRATSLQVEFRQLDGMLDGPVTDEMLFSEEELLEPELPPVITPEESGPYILHVEARRDNELLFTEERKIFVLSDPPSIDSVTVDPPTVGADSETVAVADIDPGGFEEQAYIEQELYIRWFFKDSLIDEDYVEEGGDEVEFTPGGPVGTYPLTAELFPWGPNEDVDESWTSSIVGETTVIVRETSLPDESDVLELKTVAPGEVVPPDGTLSVQLEYSDADVPRATSLRVEFRQLDETRTVTDETLFLEEELLESELSPVTTPEESGPYLLRVEAHRDNERLFTEEHKIFVLSAPPSIDSISVDPSTVGTDAEVVAVAEIDSGGFEEQAYIDGRPYIRWLFKEALIGEGYVEEGGDEVEFTPGGSDGAYTLTAELFPWGPDEGVDESWTSSIMDEVELSVRGTTSEPASDERVVLRYRFTESAVPDTDRLVEAFRPIETVGDVLDAIYSELGYQVSDGGQIRVPYNVLPLFGDAVRVTVDTDGADQSGTMIFRFIENGDELVSIDLDAPGLPSLRSLGVDTGTESRDVALLESLSDLVSLPSNQDLSFLLVNAESTIFLIPEIVGFEPTVIPISSNRSSIPPADAAFEISYTGSEERFIQGVGVMELSVAADRFNPEDQAFLYDEPDDDQSEVARGVRVDFETEEIRAVVPDGRFLFWTDLDGIPQYVVRRDGSQIIVLHADDRATPADVPDMYDTVVSGTVLGDELQFINGDSWDVASDGTVTLPATSDQEFVIVPDRLESRDDSVTVAVAAKR